MSRSHRRLTPLAHLVLVLVASCSSQPTAAMPDARATPIPYSPAGTFAIVSKLDVQLPGAARAALDPLIAATDGTDDPARYLVDRMIATLPEGTLKTVAQHAAPIIASYLNERLVEIAPHFVAGIHAIAHGTVQIATRFDLTEQLAIDASGSAVRTLTGVRFDLGAAPKTLTFVDAGLANIIVGTWVTLGTPGLHLTFADHTHRLPYGALLRAGLDLVVLPSVEPTAHDLGTVLGLLVDCQRLGTLVSGMVGLGSPTLYRVACRAGMTALANDVYRHLDVVAATAFDLHVSGAADGVDLDADGTIDDITAGTWSGTFDSADSHEPLGSATFTGVKL